MAMYAGPNGSGNVMQADLEGLKARQACITCRKQKRKCDKALPSCSLCGRMNRPCDYSDAPTAPTSEEFTALRMKLLELESRINVPSGSLNSASFVSPSGGPLSEQQVLGTADSSFPIQEHHWPIVHNRFPAILFLDGESFQYGGVTVPKPTVEIPIDTLEMLGDAISVQSIVNEYFATVHHWMPIVSHLRLTRNMVSPLWEAGPDLALLFLAMKLIISKPQDGIESSHNPLYLSAKRLVALLEAAGSASILVLQANLLVTWYEYGQAIYPAAWMSAGWCVRYGNLLGIDGKEESPNLLPKSDTWVEHEERKRVWWGVLIADRLVSIGGKGHILNSQEPEENASLPCNDKAWDNGELIEAQHAYVSTPVEETLTWFPRLCQAYMQMSRVLMHLYGPKIPSETARFGLASQLYLEVSALARKLTDECEAGNFLFLCSPLALTFSAVCTLLDEYSCDSNQKEAPTTEAVAMQAQAVEGLKSVSRNILDFAEQVNRDTQSPHDIDRVSPIIMDALYSAASNNAWIVRENGEKSSQLALETIRHCLRRLGGRWRCAAEYARILEAQEFTSALGSAGS